MFQKINVNVNCQSGREDVKSSQLIPIDNTPQDRAKRFWKLPSAVAGRVFKIRLMEVSCVVRAIPGQLSPVREAGVMDQALKWSLMHKLRKFLKRIAQSYYSCILQMKCIVCVIKQAIRGSKGRRKKNFL